MTAVTYAARVRPNAAEQYGISLVPFTYSVLHYQRTFDSSAGAPGAQQSRSSGVTLGTDLHYNLQDHVALLGAGIGTHPPSLLLSFPLALVLIALFVCGVTGYQFEQFFNVKAMVNTNAQIASSLEAMLGMCRLCGVLCYAPCSVRRLVAHYLLCARACDAGPGVSISICGDIKHAENKYAVGLGLNVGGA
jgi:hypothetical protein